MSIGDTPLRPGHEEDGITYRQYLVAAALQGLAANPAVAGFAVADVADFAVWVANEVISRLDKAAVPASESG